ncbi:MAG: hypothetical protein ACRDTE_16665 [Pseudonocardiaceae bacterium]
MTDLVDLIPALAAASVLVLSTVVLARGWHMVRERAPRRGRHSIVFPPAGVIARDPGDCDQRC